jgi:hypothetical protein
LPLSKLLPLDRLLPLSDRPLSLSDWEGLSSLSMESPLLDRDDEIEEDANDLGDLGDLIFENKPNGMAGGVLLGEPRPCAQM